MPKTPTEEFLGRIAKVRTALGVPERDMCRAAGLKSESQIGRARSGRSPMNWDHVAALTEALHEDHAVSRDWLLWGDGTMLDPELRRAAIAAKVGKRQSRGGDRTPTDPAPSPGKKSGSV